MPRFILKSTIGDAILARNGEMHASLFFGPLGLEPRIYKTRAGAERGAAARSNRRVVELDQHGHEIEAARVTAYWIIRRDLRGTEIERRGPFLDKGEAYQKHFQHQMAIAETHNHYQPRIGYSPSRQTVSEEETDR